MNISYAHSIEVSFFNAAKEQFNSLIAHLSDDSTAHQEHGVVEAQIKTQGTEILRLSFQGFLELIGSKEQRREHVANSDGEALTHVRHSTQRKLVSLFGDVKVTRKSYSQRQKGSEFPLDAQLNLSKDSFSDGLRQQITCDAIHTSYDTTLSRNKATTAGHVAKRQAISIVKDSACDFDGFYQKRQLEIEQTDSLLVLTFDGKGVVMRPDGLRECTKKRAEKTSKKLNSRLSSGEKKDRKRIAQAASVYTVPAHHRSAEEVMGVAVQEDEKASNVRNLRPKIRNKRVFASLKKPAEEVIEDTFKEALKRDPKKKRQWVVLVDGEINQLNRIDKVMKRLKVKATIVMDYIHVLEYLWKAAWCFFEKDDSSVEQWVSERALRILNGQACTVARGIKQSATKRELKSRDGVDKCAGYLSNNAMRLRYDEALAAGFPIASGVIEGACRHLINDRLDITGARWGLEGAESILKLRAINSSGDWESYWAYHRECSKQRNYAHLLTDKPS